MASGSPPVDPASGRAARHVSFVHPVNRALHEDAALGARIADGVTDFLGSWRFIAIQTVFVAIWIAGNVILMFNFDPFPFILLNLAFSTQAAYAAPLILLAGNRHAIRDRMTLEHAAAEADLEEQQTSSCFRATASWRRGTGRSCSGSRLSSSAFSSSRQASWRGSTGSSRRAKGADGSMPGRGRVDAG